MGRSPASQLSAVAEQLVASNGTISQGGAGLLRLICDGIVALWGPGCEVVIHDFSDLEHSIVYVAGDVTGRRVGDSLTDLGLRVLTAGRHEQGILIYHSKSPNGTLMKSVSILLRSKPGERALGAVCINVDVEDLYRARKVIGDLLATPTNDLVDEDFSGDPKEVIRSFVNEILEEQGRVVPALTRDQRIDVIRALDKRGAFAFRTATSIVADTLGVSRYTVYNYLKEARKTSLPRDAARPDSGTNTNQMSN